MENRMKTMREHFPARTVVIEQSLDMFGVKRNEDGTLLFPRQSGVWGVVEPKRQLSGSIEWSITGKSIS